MQELERLVEEGNYVQVLRETATWTDKQRREAAKWLAGQAGQLTVTALTATYEKDGGARWMCLLVAQAACVSDVKKAFAIPPPRYADYGVAWDEFDATLKVPAAAIAALIEAVARRGRDWAQAWVAAAAEGKRKRPMFGDVLMALAIGFGLDLPSDGYLARAWGVSLFRLCQVPHWHPSQGERKPYDQTVVAMSVTPAPDGGLHVEARDVRGTSALECARALFGLRPAMAALLSRRDDVLALAGRYTGADNLESVTQVVGGLVAGGELDRGEMTANLIAALTRGDSVSAQRLQARLLAAAQPGPDLLAAHAQTLGSLLASANGSAAEVAQTLLARLDAAQALPAALFIDSCQMVFARKEKGLRRDQLAWAARRLKDHPSQCAATVQGLIEALAVDDYALQKDAVGKIAIAWSGVEPAQRAPLLALADASQGALDDKLHAQLMASLGSVAPAAAAPSGAAVPPAPRTPPVRTPVTPQPFQRLRNLAKDPSGYLAALAEFNTMPGIVATEQLLEFAVQASNAGERSIALKLAGRFGTVGNHEQLLATQGRNPPPGTRYDVTRPAVATVARLRLHEVLSVIESGRKYALLSTPSYVNGAIDPADLMPRMAAMFLLQTQTGPLDLLLALMRTLPPTPGQIAEWRSSAIPEALIAANFFAAGGIAQMTTHWLVTDVEPDKPYRYGNTEWVSRERREVCVGLRGMAVLPAIEAIPVLWSRGFEPATAPDVWEFDILPQYLGAVMPNNAEILAALHLWGFRKGGHDGRSDGGKATIMGLPHFLAAGGPAGPALHLAVMLSLSANEPQARIAGSDGLVTLLQQGRYDEALACALLAACVTHGSIKCGRLAASLSRVAEAGEELAVWPLVRSSLAAALALDAAPPGTADLMSLASRLAPLLGMREDIPALDALAAGKGSGKLLTEARRLHELLAQ
jgi:hypothetical protein